MTNKNKNYIMIKLNDLSNEKQLEIEQIHRARAEEQVNEEVSEGHTTKDDAPDRVEAVMSEYESAVWMELEV